MAAHREVAVGTVTLPTYSVKQLPTDSKKWAVFDEDRQVSSWFWNHSDAQTWADEGNKVVAYALSRRWRFGVLVRKESAWIGVHYSPYNKRWCINLVPFVTVWITKPGGNAP